jgi:hypothetical protein
MKETDLRNKVLAGIIKYNSVKQGSVGHKEILKIFNDSGLCSRYKMTVNDPWCATTASAAYIKAGLAGQGKGKIFPCVECSCSRMIQLAKDAGIWQENDGYKPKVADLILYDWDDSGIGDNTGAPEHVGIVAAVDGNTIKVFEGNKDNACGYRTLTVNGRYIRGYITPNFAAIADKELDGKVLDSTGLKKGDKSLGVLAVKQLLLIARRKGIVSAIFDNNQSFGNGTEKAVNQALKKFGYKQTGVAGEIFIKKLGEFVVK